MIWLSPCVWDDILYTKEALLRCCNYRKRPQQAHTAATEGILHSSICWHSNVILLTYNWWSYGRSTVPHSLLHPTCKMKSEMLTRLVRDGIGFGKSFAVCAAPGFLWSSHLSETILQIPVTVSVPLSLRGRYFHKLGPLLPGVCERKAVKFNRRVSRCTLTIAYKCQPLC